MLEGFAQVLILVVECIKARQSKSNNKTRKPQGPNSLLPLSAAVQFGILQYFSDQAESW